MRRNARLLPVALLLPALLLAGCDAIVDRDRRSMPAIPLTPATEVEAGEETQAEEGPIRFERNTGYDGSVLTIFGDPDPDKPNARPELTTARNALDRGEPFRPNMPGHSGWRWNLLNLGQDGTTYAYAAISWHDDDPMDYLAAGYWFHYPRPLPGPDAEGIDAAGFVDGPELDPIQPPDLPLEGRATYQGFAGGTYFYQYGQAWGDELAGTYGFEEYIATATLTADFGEGTVEGCIGCTGDVTINRLLLHDWLGDELNPIDALPTDYEIHLPETSFDRTAGTFENPRVTVRHPDRRVLETEGHWGGQFSNRPGDSGNPRLGAGFADALFTEADGSTGSFWGMFNALSTTWAPPDGDRP